MKKWLKIVLGTLAIILALVVLVSSQQSQEETVMQAPEITIHINGDPLLMKEEINNLLKDQNLYEKGMRYQAIPFEKIKQSIDSLPEVSLVKVYSKIGDQWFIEITQREPIVRVIDNNGKGYYIAKDGTIIRAKNEHPARVLIASGKIDPIGKLKNLQTIINNDSLKTINNLDDIYRISNYVCNNPFLSAQIGQIYLREDGETVLVPQVGDQVIIFGSANDDDEVKRKFENLITFYKEGIRYEGWDKYSEISLKFEGQIVCKKKLI